MNIKLQPWQTPNFVIGVMPPRPRQEGWNLNQAKWALKEVDAETLAKMCDDFRAEIFRKSEKLDPALCCEIAPIRRKLGTVRERLTRGDYVPPSIK